MPPEPYPKNSLEGYWSCGNWVARTPEGKRFILDQCAALMKLCDEADRLGKHLEFVMGDCTKCGQPQAPRAFSTIYVRANLFQCSPSFQWRIA